MTISLQAEFFETAPGEHHVQLRFADSIIQCTPEDVSALIAALADIRQQLQPPIPTELRTGQTIATEAAPAFYTEPNDMVDGSTLVLRHAGLGWISYSVPLESLKKLHHLFGLQIQRIESGRKPTAH
ncbi:hypothetical protein C6V05_20850 [Burkholderia multivorans]|nr:hypothetical protein C6V05_20850 [Burkholderia multivorans]